MNRINESDSVKDIVTKDYRTTAVFRKYGIDFCCGAKFPLETVCSIKDLDLSMVKRDLENATRTIYVPNSLKYDEWDLCFLADYIVHVHHAYLRTAMPETLDCLQRFAEGHQEKYSYVSDLENAFATLLSEMLPHFIQEEETIFPYIKQIEHAYKSRESYASLLVRTSRKPVEDVMKHEHDEVKRSLSRLRELTNDYTPPPNACTNHTICFCMLREIDNDFVQHLHLENNILFTKAIAMEKELLQKN